MAFIDWFCWYVMPYKDLEQYKTYQKEYRIKNKEKLDLYDKEKYQKNKISIIKRVMNYNKNNPEKNKIWQQTIIKNRKKRFYDFLYPLKSKPCTDCNKSYPPYVMQFDHRPGEIKSNEVGTMLGCSEDKIASEIAKCDLVCANCHAIRTWTRRQQTCKS